jgi:hypothetical protein
MPVAHSPVTEPSAHADSDALPAATPDDRNIRDGGGGWTPLPTASR